MEKNTIHTGEFGDGFDSPPTNMTDVTMLLFVLAFGWMIVPLGFIVSKWLTT